MAVNFACPQDMDTHRPVDARRTATAALAIAALAKFGRVRWNDRVLQLYAAFIRKMHRRHQRRELFYWMQAVQSLVISFLAFASSAYRRQHARRAPQDHAGSWRQSRDGHLGPHAQWSRPGAFVGDETIARSGSRGRLTVSSSPARNAPNSGASAPRWRSSPAWPASLPRVMGGFWARRGAAEHRHLRGPWFKTVAIIAVGDREPAVHSQRVPCGHRVHQRQG
jgi:hypothetical protein